MPTFSRMLFHSRHATWHALQPMHFETSISFATSVSRFSGGGTDDAERCTRSRSDITVAISLVGGLGSSNSNAIFASPYDVAGPERASMSTRKALYSGVSIF